MMKLRAPEWADSKLGQAWWSFHLRNPHVYRALVDMAFEWRATGEKKCSIAMLWEHCRWEFHMHDVNLNAARGLPNAHRAYYARYLMMGKPKLDGFFNLAELRSRR